jgi:hypothetical protein
MLHALGEPRGGAAAVAHARVERREPVEDPAEHEGGHRQGLLVEEAQPQVGVEAGEALVAARAAHAVGHRVEEHRDVAGVCQGGLEVGVASVQVEAGEVG